MQFVCRYGHYHTVVSLDFVSENQLDDFIVKSRYLIRVANLINRVNRCVQVKTAL